MSNFVLFLHPEIKNKLEKMAKELKTSQSAVIRMALNSFLDQPDLLETIDKLSMAHEQLKKSQSDFLDLALNSYTGRPHRFVQADQAQPPMPAPTPTEA